MHKFFHLPMTMLISNPLPRHALTCPPNNKTNFMKFCHDTPNSLMAHYASFQTRKYIWTLTPQLHCIAPMHTPLLSPNSIFSNKNSIVSSASMCLHLPAALNGSRAPSSYPRKTLASAGSLFRALNKALRRKVYHIPRIQKILARRTGYAFLSKLDISMQYYTFKLDDASKDLCTIATPFGLYRYCRLPMGINQSPDIAQEIMERVLRAIDDIEVYIDDIACFSNDFDSNIALLDLVFNRLQNHGFAINPLKCEWAVQETNFLGHWLTPTGLKPWMKKIQAILDMQPPTNIKQLRSFLGLVTYYCDMWPCQSHILAPLTDLLRTPKTFCWNDECAATFEQMKSLIASDALLAYPDHNKPFHIETDASDLQLGAIIKQENRPVAYYTHKLNSAQKNYTTIEKELLSIVETFREFRSMLLGARINVYTDHKNLTHRLSQFTTQRVMRWRLLLEEYGPKFYYLKGPRNVVANALS